MLECIGAFRLAQEEVDGGMEETRQHQAPLDHLGGLALARQDDQNRVDLRTIRIELICLIAHPLFLE